MRDPSGQWDEELLFRLDQVIGQQSEKMCHYDSALHFSARQTETIR